jgi:hypothetical protein
MIALTIWVVIIVSMTVIAVLAILTATSTLDAVHRTAAPNDNTTMRVVSRPQLRHSVQECCRHLA